MEKITRLQKLYLQKVCFLLLSQLMVLLLVVWFVHKFFPETICFMTCNQWLDLFLYLVLAVLLIYTSYNGKTIAIRYMAFFAVSALLAYILALQYNILTMLKGNDKQVADNFIKAVVLVVFIFIVNLLLLPFTLGHMNTILVLSTSLFVCLLGVILWGLFIQKGFLVWVSVGLFVFMGLLITDLTLLVSRCKKSGSIECDPLNGASLLYVDLINILQQIFILLNSSNHR